MKQITALKTVAIIAAGGILFSGYLSYTELFKSVCTLGGCSYVLGFPACVYGFIMYTVVLIIAALGIYSKN